ncbi:MarR family winged helix-turn-helix transcriptional regulator [Roseomonas sp. BN140053]|uniref:MarR family winged helix-turn-helix transcriptional regulator n=1 Tax=Roseomonas sp. BN140053 TaxID=3391898 RepID=UPI0039ED8C82
MQPSHTLELAPPAGADPGDLTDGPLARHVGFLLRLAQQRIFEEFHRRFGSTGLTPARYSVLALVGTHPGTRQVAVAGALQIKQPNLAVLITAMAADGLVERRTDASNRRANGLFLTPAGAALLARVRPQVEAMEAEFCAGLGPGQQDALLATLRTLLAP